MLEGAVVFFHLFKGIHDAVKSVTAMVTNHLRAPYGVFFTKNRTILRRPAGGRKNRTIFYQVFRHRTVPGEV